MKHAKRILSFALVLVMVLSCMPIQALAAENEETAYVAINKSTSKGYESLLVAMSECRKGETVALQKDASEMQVLVPADGILDLNGCTLEAEYMSCFGDLIDSSDDNSGLLKVNEDYFLVRGDNKQLPIKDGTGFRFVEITKINTKMLTPTKFVFQPLFEAAALDLIAKGGDVTGLTVQVLVSWKQNDGYRTQKFVYNDDLLTQFLGSYNAATGKYSKMFTLTLNNVDGIEELSFAAVLASSTKVTISSNDPVEEETEEIFSASTNLNKNDLIYGTLANEVTLSGTTGVSAVVPAAVKVENGAAALALSVKKAETGSEITLGEGESAQSLDVHIAGVAADNKVPMIVNLGAILEKGLSDTELKLYHTENGVAVLMTRVASAADFAIHNQYTYNPETGEVSIYVASFSVFTGVKTTADVWDGTADISWYNENDTEFTLTTAEQFAGFRDLVDGGNTFEGKTIKLGMDIDLAGKPFNPIGRDYVHLGGQAFMGTFDGANHTIYNLYQNGWELGDSYNTAGGGLFASIKDATIKNLAVSGANIVFECVDMGIVVGYAQGYCTFENIVVTNSTIANYNRSTGGVVGEVCMGTEKLDANKGEYTHTFKNITVDSSVTVSSLWGSFDTSCGGVIGGKWDNTGWDPVSVYMENITVAAKLDVFSDVTAAYQWYAYRRCGMLIGYTEQESPKKALNAAAEFLTCEDVEVYYGGWVNYTYYEFAEQDSDTGKRYPWVRAEVGLNNGAFSNARYGVPTVDGVKITKDNALELSSAYTPIVFNQLYGGGQGVYGTNEHVGVTIYNKDTKTVYIYDANETENLKLQYWYKHGEDEWSTHIEGIDMSTMLLGDKVYKIEIPLYANGFKITGTGIEDKEILLGEVNEDGIYDLSGEVHVHDYTDGKCDCGVEQQKEWQLVTDASQLQIGDKIVIVAKDYDVALSTTQNNNNRGAAAVTKNGNTITFGTDVQIITLEAGTVDNTFAFNVGDGYLYAASDSSNHLKTQDTIKGNGSWAVVIDAEGIATIKASENSHNWLRFNEQNNPDIFSCYASGQKDVAIYKLVVGCEHLYVQSGVTAPTCTEDGSITYTCTKCGEEKVVVAEKLGHAYSSEVTTKATCTTAGVKTYTCSKCNDSYTEEIEATGHTFGDPEITKQPTCTEEGEQTGTCTVCGETTTEKLDALGHTAADAVQENIVNATCGEAGSYDLVVYCSVCHEKLSTEAKEIPAIGNHNYVDGICSVCGEAKPVVKQWTLVTNVNDLKVGDKIIIVANGSDVALSTTQNGNNRGQTAYTKGDIPGNDVQIITLQTGNISGTFAFYVEGNSVGYLYAASSSSNYLRTETTLSDNSSWTITITSAGVATIKAQGTYTRNLLKYNSTSSIFSCYGSGQQDVAIYKETVVCGHASTTTASKAPTCTEAGYTNATVCADCGVVVEEGTTVPATGHVNTTTTTVDATCTVAGSTTVTCDDCEAVVSRTEIPVIDHNYVDGACSACGAKDPDAGSGGTDEPTVVLEITKDDFNSTSYAANNKTKTEGDYSYTSYQVMLQSGAMQWQKSKGYITIASNEFVKLEIKATAGTYTVTVGGKTVTGTTSNGVTTYDLTGLNGQIKISVGSATGKVDYLKFYK